MNRFFTKSQTQSLSRPEGKNLSCFTCGLYKNCKSPKMVPYGNFKKGILNIGEAPGEFEDKKGLPWQGRTGRLLQETYKKLGIDLFEDCLNINAVSCRPMDSEGGNRTPSNIEIETCRRFVLSCIKKYNPKIIILLGNVAVQSLIGYRWKKDLGGITKWRGFRIPDRDFKCWICPTLHPSFIERGGPAEQTVWENDLHGIFSLVKTPLPAYVEPEIEVIENLSVIEKIESESAIDYETTGIKPHAPGHRIISAAVSDDENHAFVFLMPLVRGLQRPFLNFLANPAIGKIGQNIKFEQSWSTTYLLQPVENWVWDTMLATHLLDNRDGITGLKFQVYVNFGIVDYDSDIESFLKAEEEKNSNSINRITELLKQPGGKEKLLKYNGLDAVYTMRLAKIQMTDIQLPF
jgi:uracil-DNA glycosylase